MPLAMPGEPATTFTRIPDKYGDPEKSKLTYKVNTGSQTHNIDLAD